MDAPERIYLDAAWASTFVSEDGYRGNKVHAYVLRTALDAATARAEAAEAEARTARADALREAADLINARGVREQENCGLGAETQNFYRARDIVRALIDKEPK